jgi:hypothetical protein
MQAGLALLGKETLAVLVVLLQLVEAVAGLRKLGFLLPGLPMVEMEGQVFRPL